MATKQTRLTPFGRKVRKRLIDKNMTQVELAALLGCNKQYIHKILVGERSGKKYIEAISRMSDMMKMFVEQELQNQIKENYPHMQYPPGLYAKVVSVRQNGELYEATLKILDKNKQPDIRFPEVPKVKTDIPVLKNEIVAIVLMYGECKPYIIGRCF